MMPVRAARMRETAGLLGYGFGNESEEKKKQAAHGRCYGGHDLVKHQDIMALYLTRRTND